MADKKVKTTPRVEGKSTEHYFRSGDALTNELIKDAKENFGNNRSLTIRSRLNQFYGLK